MNIKMVILGLLMLVQGYTYASGFEVQPSSTFKSPKDGLIQLEPLALRLIDFIQNNRLNGRLKTLMENFQDEAQAILNIPGVLPLVNRLQVLGVVIEWLRIIGAETPNSALVLSASSKSSGMQGKAERFLALTMGTTNDAMPINVPHDSVLVSFAASRNGPPFRAAGILVPPVLSASSSAKTLPFIDTAAYTRELEARYKGLIALTLARLGEDFFWAELGLSPDKRVLLQRMLQGGSYEASSELLTILQKNQIQALQTIDSKVGTIPPNSIRCLTWINSCVNGQEFVFPPIATTVRPDAKLHFMLYEDHGFSEGCHEALLKVVVENYLIEIPYEVRKPENQAAMFLLVVAEPLVVTDEPGKKTVSGVNVMLFSYKPPKKANQSPKLKLLAGPALHAKM